MLLLDMNEFYSFFHYKCIKNVLKNVQIIAKLLAFKYLTVAYLKIQNTYEIYGYLWYVKLKCPRVTFTLKH